MPIHTDNFKRADLLADTFRASGDLRFAAAARDVPPSTPARDAYETMRLCFAAEQSAGEKRAVKLNQIGSQ